MRHSKLAGAAVLACLTGLATAGSARALTLRLSPIYERVSMAECIILGKVTALENKTVGARQFPMAAQPSEFRLASVHITMALHGLKGLTDIRVGFVAPQQPINRPMKDGGLRPHIRIGGMPLVTLTKGQEALLFLTKHFEKNFYVFGYMGVINKTNNPNYDKELAMVKRCVKLLEKPNAGLKSKDASDRLLTAAMLLQRYRTFPVGGGPQAKTEPIDAKQSKLILTVLAESDLSKYDQEIQVHPAGLFYRLGLTAKDGWTPPQDFKQTNDAIKDWLTKNADTYRIQRYVADKKGKKEERKDRK
jgi:hypothetical protein